MDTHQRDVMHFQLQGLWQNAAAVETSTEAGKDELLLMSIGWYALYQSMMNASSGAM